MRPRVWLLLLGACAGPRAPQEPPPEAAPEPPSAEAPSAATAPPGLPAGFKVEGEPEVEPPFLPPGAMWRFLVSQLTTLRADARAREEDLLVTFEAAAVHVTERSGRRRSWRLPDGLRLEGGPAHLLLGADLATSAYGADGAQFPPAKEITVVRARVEGGEGGVVVFRLVIKGGRGFRSISTPG
ncbi:MAG: hypothetical protein ACYTEZ_17285 [Planctomycetota bacterium]|jgi:hypothetical protein